MKDNKSEFLVNGLPFWKAKPFMAKLGEKQLWIVKNDSDWDHPFHLHGFRFQVLSRQPLDGVSVDEPDVEFGQPAPSTDAVLDKALEHVAEKKPAA